MTLLQGEYIIDDSFSIAAASSTDLEQFAKSHLLRVALKRLGERDDFFETEDSFRGTGYRFRAHVFSEAELAEYRNRIITEFLCRSGKVSAALPVPTKEDN